MNASKEAVLAIPLFIMRTLSKRNSESFSDAAVLKLTGRSLSVEPIDVVVANRLRAGIFRGTEKCDGCDEFIRWICIEFDANGVWNSLLTMDERNFPHLVSFVEKMKKSLGIMI